MGIRETLEFIGCEYHRSAPGSHTGIWRDLRCQHEACQRVSEVLASLSAPNEDAEVVEEAYELIVSNWPNADEDDGDIKQQILAQKLRALAERLRVQKFDPPLCESHRFAVSILETGFCLACSLLKTYMKPPTCPTHGEPLTACDTCMDEETEYA